MNEKKEEDEDDIDYNDDVKLAYDDDVETWVTTPSEKMQGPKTFHLKNAY